MIDLNQVSLALRNCTERSLILLDEFGKGTMSTGQFDFPAIYLLSASALFSTASSQTVDVPALLTPVHRWCRIVLRRYQTFAGSWNFLSQSPGCDTFSSSEFGNTEFPGDVYIIPAYASDVHHQSRSDSWYGCDNQRSCDLWIKAW